MLLSLLFSFHLFAADLPQDPTLDSTFESGVAAYQKQNYEEASTQLKKALELAPENTNVLTNLALSQFQLGHKAIAVALLRKANSLDPDFSTPRSALDFIVPQLEVREIPHEIQLSETFRTAFLNRVPLNGFLSLTALFLFSSGWLLIGFLGKRRRALQSETPLPPFPSVGLLLALFFVAGSFLSFAKIWDFQVSRGTVTSEKVAVLSAPDEKSVPLFELYGGLEVIIEDETTSGEGDQKKNWIQVTYPGAFTGWVLQDNVFQTSGRRKFGKSGI